MCLFGGEIRWMENFGEKMGRKSFLVGVWLENTRAPPKCFLSKMERKLKREIGHHFWTKMPMYNCIFTHVAFLHTFFPLHCLPLFFFWFTGQACLVFFLSFFLFIFFIFFIYGHDFYFLINLGDWIFFWFFITFCVLIGHHFFNKGIYVNLYKLTYSILPFFHSQPNKKKEN